MSRCACGSYAINIGAHGRVSGKNKDLCDVCYWRADYDALAAELATVKKVAYGNLELMEDRDAAQAECERLRNLLSEAKAALDPFDDKLLDAKISAALSPKP